MKKLVFGFVAVVAFGLNVNAKEVVASSQVVANEKVVLVKSEGEDLLKINIHIEWGRKSKGCMGFGICSTDIILEGDISDFVGLVTRSGNFQVEISKSGMDGVLKTFGGKVITIEEDFTLSSDVCSKIGLREGYVIKAGKYNIVTDAAGVNSVIF